MKSTANIKTVADLEAYLKTHWFRQDPDNEEHRDISEYRHITEDGSIEDENWIRYQFFRFRGYELNHHNLWNDIQNSDEWEILVKNDKCHMGVAVHPRERKILLMFFDFWEDTPSVIKFEHLARTVDFKRRLDRILNNYLIWMGDAEELFSDSEADTLSDEVYALAEKYKLHWRSGKHPRLKWIEEDEEIPKWIGLE